MYVCIYIIYVCVYIFISAIYICVYIYAYIHMLYTTHTYMSRCLGYPPRCGPQSRCRHDEARGIRSGEAGLRSNFNERFRV